ncbi:MAG TPA: TDT family transporter [Methanocorpusculum sp.]|nr:TDT family transporter [Methanocorpusculum sp.]
MVSSANRYLICANRFLSILPIPFGGVMLSFACLGLLVSCFFSGYTGCPGVGMVLHIICGCAAALIWILFIAKCIFCFPQVKTALKDPAAASVSGTFCMSTMMLAVYLKEIAGDSAVILWWAGIFLHAALIVLFSVRFLHPFKIQNVYPSWLVVYVGILVASITSPYFSQEVSGQVIFWFGVVCCIVLTPVLLLRQFKYPLPDGLKPLVCIFAAPVSILAASYVQAFDADFRAAGILLAVESVILIIILAALPKLLRLSFSPAHAAFTFPFHVTASAFLFGIGVLIVNGFPPEFIWIAAAGILAVSAVLVCVTARFVMMMGKEMKGCSNVV